MREFPSPAAVREAAADHQWIHVDPARAANGPFGGTIAHGYLTLSLLPMLADGGVQMVSRVTVEGEGSPKPCCVAETVSRVYT